MRNRRNEGETEKEGEGSIDGMKVKETEGLEERKRNGGMKYKEKEWKKERERKADGEKEGIGVLR